MTAICPELACPLAEVKQASQLTIKAINMDAKTRSRLLGMGIAVGQNIEVLHNNGGDVVVGCGRGVCKNGEMSGSQCRLTLGKGICEHIMVEH
jgi:Fe2+ transport system protein FeoA